MKYPTWNLTVAIPVQGLQACHILGGRFDCVRCFSTTCLSAAGLCKRRQAAGRTTCCKCRRLAIYRKHEATEPPTPSTNRPPELQKPTCTHTSPAPMPPPAALAAIAACRAGRTCKFCFVTLAQILANVLCTGPLVLRYQCSGQGSLHGRHGLCQGRAFHDG